jgi:Asp-tRNA(Asn)/Glu-tRNA(Gln) amidotransferase A subunit family amidase
MHTAPSSSPSLVELSAVELRRLIGARQVSPVELLDACIARIDSVSPMSTPSPRPVLTARAAGRMPPKRP